MAVVAMWQCDRDGRMFANKKDADAYDKMLELAESFTQFIEKNSTSISAEDAESIGLLLSKHKDKVVNACKGKTEALLSVNSDDSLTPSDEESETK